MTQISFISETIYSAKACIHIWKGKYLVAGDLGLPTMDLRDPPIWLSNPSSIASLEDAGWSLTTVYRKENETNCYNMTYILYR